MCCKRESWWPEALLGKVAPRAVLRGVTLFCPKIDDDQKKGLRHKISGFLVRMVLETKENEKAKSSPQISGFMVVSHHFKVSPQNGFTRSCPPPPPPSDATVGGSFSSLLMSFGQSNLVKKNAIQKLFSRFSRQIFRNCELALHSHICFLIKLVYH